MHGRASTRERGSDAGGPALRYTLNIREIDGTQLTLVGGKGASLGELSRIDGVRVPDGFCVTTDAFRRIMAEAPPIDTGTSGPGPGIGRR